jgi:hypothetical protein
MHTHKPIAQDAAPQAHEGCVAAAPHKRQNRDASWEQWRDCAGKHDTHMHRRRMWCNICSRASPGMHTTRVTGDGADTGTDSRIARAYTRLKDAPYVASVHSELALCCDLCAAPYAAALLAQPEIKSVHMLLDTPALDTLIGGPTEVL